MWWGVGYASVGYDGVVVGAEGVVRWGEGKMGVRDEKHNFLDFSRVHLSIHFF